MKVLHIGYARTGTTTLQREVFRHLGGYIGKYGLAENEVRTAALDILLGLKTKTPLPDADFCSDEAFLRPGDIAGRAALTKKAFPDTKILLSIRRQDHLIGSQYTWDCKSWKMREKPSYPIDAAIRQDMHDCVFPACMLNCTCYNIKSISLPYFDFEATRQVYAEHFDVMVLPLELLTSNTQNYCDLLCDFAGITRKAAPAISVNNALPSKSYDTLDRFTDSNRKLKSPVDLSRWGYF